MFNMDTPVKEVYKNPIGKDFMDKLFLVFGKKSAAINNPLASSLKLSQIDKLFGKKLPGLSGYMLDLLNREQETPPKSPGIITQKFWKEAIVYQIYPRSFQDSNGDGIGDLNGIKQRIPYLKELGVDMVWLSPVYDSPNDDMGYDIRNYRKIMKEFGNLRDFNSLVNELHKNGIKLIMDLVVNHTSDEHEWFQKALKNPDSPYKDYYIWKKGQDKNGEVPPNNWNSFFSGPAWNYYPEQNEWAMHAFSKKQMDLNWDNPELRAEIYEMINWWLEKGVDGFRLDVISLISKGNFDNGSPYMEKQMGICGLEQYFYGPHLHEYLREMREETFDKHGAFSVGETVGFGMEMGKMISAEERKELDMVFNFDHIENPGKYRLNPYLYDLKHLKTHFLNWQLNYGNNCWQSLFFENHDNPRMISKINPDPAYRPVIAKLLATLQLTLKGTPFIYQGQEIGMTNTRFKSVDEFRDIEAINRFNELVESGEWSSKDAFRKVAWGTRDHARTPMQWDATPNAGFTEGEPWINVNPNSPTINVENEVENPNSIYNYFKELIALRKEDKTLVYGDFIPVFTKDKDTFCYFRNASSSKYYIEINLTSENVRRKGPLTSSHNFLLGNYGGVGRSLRPYEANIYKICE